MPSKTARRRQRPRASPRVQTQKVWYPIAYLITKTGRYTTTVETLSKVFDRARAFRLRAVRLEASASLINGTARPFIIQLDVFSPVSASDSVWSSQLRLVPSSGKLRLRQRWPVDTVPWYPSETAANTPLFKLAVTCEYKDQQPVGLIQAYVLLEMGNWEDDGSCPTVTADVEDDEEVAGFEKLSI